MITTKLLDGAVQIGSISIGKAQLVAGAVALILSLALYFLMSKTDSRPCNACNLRGQGHRLRDGHQFQPDAALLHGALPVPALVLPVR